MPVEHPIRTGSTCCCRSVERTRRRSFAPRRPCAVRPVTFMGLAATDPDVNQTSLVIVNGAAEDQAAQNWEARANPNYDRISLAPTPNL